jgi:hypothetical protein
MHGDSFSCRLEGRAAPEGAALVELTYSRAQLPRNRGDSPLPVDTVKTRMFRARRRLKALLADGVEEAA